MNTRLKTIVLLFVSILGLSIVIPDQTMASSNASNLFCYGSTCSGKWPDVEGCSSGASTVMTAPGSGPSGTIEAQLRWSSACNANWARAQSYSGNRYMKAELYTNGCKGTAIIVIIKSTKTIVIVKFTSLNIRIRITA